MTRTMGTSAGRRACRRHRRRRGRLGRVRRWCRPRHHRVVGRLRMRADVVALDHGAREWGKGKGKGPTPPDHA